MALPCDKTHLGCHCEVTHDACVCGILARERGFCFCKRFVLFTYFCSIDVSNAMTTEKWVECFNTTFEGITLKFWGRDLQADVRRRISCEEISSHWMFLIEVERATDVSIVRSLINMLSKSLGDVELAYTSPCCLHRFFDDLYPDIRSWYQACDSIVGDVTLLDPLKDEFTKFVNLKYPSSSFFFLFFLLFDNNWEVFYACRLVQLLLCWK